MARKIQKSNAPRVRKPDDLGPPSPPSAPKSNHEKDEDLERLSDIAREMGSDFEVEEIDDEGLFTDDGDPVAARIINVRRRGA